MSSTRLIMYTTNMINFCSKTLVEKFDFLYNLIILLKIVFYSNPEIRGEETSLLAINIKEPHVIKNLLNQKFWSR